MKSENARCIVCEQDNTQVPLLPFQYQDNQYWICPQHLPILIHKPATLADKLPGLELLSPPASH
jgi:hypothetical protein